ncbi:MAG: hypothetical protein HY550_10680 [Elusimicrobia bacterium]|nr:hypothetical protein [Elusimicrobiota bacterium]
MLATVLILLGALAAMKVFFALARFAFGPQDVYRLKPLLHDSLGFAFSAAGTALTQYCFAGLFRRTGVERLELAVIVSFTALFCGLLFWRGALFTSLGAYGFSGLAVTLAALLGGLAAAFEEPGGELPPAAFP